MLQVRKKSSYNLQRARDSRVQIRLFCPSRSSWMLSPNCGKSPLSSGCFASGIPQGRHLQMPDRRPAAADVATPRPREVGGACRIQVLAIARTQETVGGPNEAARSEFRRDGLPVGAKSSSMHYILAQLQKPQNRHYSALGA